MSQPESPPPAISTYVWDQKYRFKDAGGQALDVTLADTWWRVARAAAAAEPEAMREHWAARFHGAMERLEFLPAGRIIAGAGTGRGVTLFNCFVMGRIEDDLASIFDNVKEAALTMQQGGGIGHDFSTLRPQGALVRSVGAGASGPVSFMDVWDGMCRTIMSAGQRRGAMMATLRCDHPDIETFIAAKAEPGRLRNFNLSVLVTDAFMAAVRADDGWDLGFEGRVWRRVRARDLWGAIMRSTYDYAEPGVVFIDRINQLNNLAYCEDIRATNPCGEQPLPPYGACLLGSINLARLVARPFTAEAAVDEARLEALVPVAVRLLDNVIDVSGYPLPAQRAEALAKRRIGLGVTGLADALVMTGVAYGSDEARRRAGRWIGLIERAAYRASADLAAEKGAFPAFEATPFLASPNVARQPAAVREAIARHGIRNGCLTSIAPTGTISLLAHNVSSGIEPVFDFRYRRRIREGTSLREEWVEDYAHALFRRLAGPKAPLPPAFVTATDLSPDEHLGMQAAVQAHVDSAISKTVNCAQDIAFSAFEGLYTRAFDLGLKGCTTFRPNAVTGSVLASGPPADEGVPDGRSGPGETVGDGTGRVGSGRGGERGARGLLPPPAAPADAAARAATGPPAAGHAGGAAAGRAGSGASADADPVVDAAARTAVARRPLGADVVWMARPLEREPVLAGYTYKLKWAGSDHALYITINDIEQDGRRRPFEIFINTKNLDHYAWTVALTRMISAVFRRGGDVSFVVEELKAVFDPQGGQWMGGRYVPSLLAAIGEIIEGHMLRIGLLQSSDGAAEAGPREGAVASAGPPPVPLAAQDQGRADVRGAGASASASTSAWPPPEPRPDRLDALRLPAGARRCPRCGTGAMLYQSGCWTCRDCGFSKCG